MKVVADCREVDIASFCHFTIPKLTCFQKFKTKLWAGYTWVGRCKRSTFIEHREISCMLVLNSMKAIFNLKKELMSFIRVLFWKFKVVERADIKWEKDCEGWLWKNCRSNTMA